MPTPALLPSLLETIDTLTDGLIGGQVTPTEWHNQVSIELFAHHLATFAQASGRDEKDVLEAVKEIVGKQIDYLNNFTDQIEAGDYDDRENALRARAAMYSGSLKQSLWAGKTDGWPLPFMPAEDTECHNNCLCGWRVDVLDEEAGDADAHWERHANDSCSTCMAREADNPYEIRGGELL